MLCVMQAVLLQIGTNVGDNIYGVWCRQSSCKSGTTIRDITPYVVWQSSCKRRTIIGDATWCAR